MTSAAAPSRSRRAAALAAVGSIALHGGGIALAARLEPRAPEASRPVEVVFETVEPPPAEARPAAPPPAPAPRAAVLPRPVPAVPPPLPPPNEAPPPEARPARPVPRVGISLSSTATGGAFAVGVGNTLHGKASEIAADPAEVKPYAGPSTPGRLSGRPTLLAQPEVPYPPEARKAGVEGKVVLALLVGRDGSVHAARVLSEPGSGLGEAARLGALRFRFSPALLDGEAVETEIRFTYTFVLE